MVPAAPVTGRHGDLTVVLWGVPRPTTLQPTVLFQNQSKTRNGETQCFSSDGGEQVWILGLNYGSLAAAWRSDKRDKVPLLPPEAFSLAL